MKGPGGAFHVAAWDLEKHTGDKPASVRKGAAGIPGLGEGRLDAHHGLRSGIVKVAWLIQVLSVVKKIPCLLQ